MVWGLVSRILFKSTIHLRIPSNSYEYKKLNWDRYTQIYHYFRGGFHLNLQENQLRFEAKSKKPVPSFRQHGEKYLDKQQTKSVRTSVETWVHPSSWKAQCTKALEHGSLSCTQLLRQHNGQHTTSKNPSIQYVFRLLSRVFALAWKLKVLEHIPLT